MQSAEQQELFDAGIQDYLAAFNAGDYETVASYWTEDAISCPPIGEEIEGRDALREFYRTTFESLAPKLSGYSCDCHFDGSTVCVRERWIVTMNPAGQPSQTLTGRGLWAGRRGSDGVWRTFWSLARLDP